MLPLILLASAWVTVPIALVMGACLGMLLVHVLHDLKLEKSRQHTGVAVLLARWPEAGTALRICGGAYLLWLGGESRGIATARAGVVAWARRHRLTTAAPRSPT